MNEVWQDVRYGLRALRRSPGLTAVMVLTLALGIGANTAIFSVVNGVLLQPLPYAEGRELFRLVQSAPLADVEDAGVSVQELNDYRQRNRSLSEVVEYHSLWFSLLDRGEPERVQSGVVSWNFFDVMGVEPLLGRTFTRDEDRLGAEPVLVLGYDFWQSHFGGDPSVVGRTVEMNDHVHTIVGVLPPIPQYPDDNDVWMPWYACPFRSGPGWQENRGTRPLTVLGRVRSGTEMEHAHDDVARIMGELSAEYPEEYPPRLGVQASLVPLEEELTQNARPTFLILLAMSGLVLLIACANVANLTLARMSRREQEMAVRVALGAGRSRLVRQLLTESTLVALVGGVLGLALARALLGLLVDLSTRFTPLSGEVRIDGWVLLFTAALALGTGVGVGIMPALFTGRDVSHSLREGTGRASSSRAKMRTRGLLVSAQLAVTFVLLIGAGLMIRSFTNLQRVDPGFDAQNVLTAQVDLDWSVYMRGDGSRAFWQTLHERVGAIPGVEAAGLASSFPLDGNAATNPVQVEGQTVEDGEIAPVTGVANVTPGYFETLRVPLLQGRDFGSTDHADAPPVAIVNRSMAQHRWPGRDPIGQRVSFDGQRWLTVVGVVGDVKEEGLDGEFVDQLYLPLAQGRLLSGRVVVRTRSDPRQLSRQVIDAVHAVDPRQPVAFVRTMEEVRRESIASPRLTALLLGLFAAVALAISVAGILGLVAYSVGQRTREIGVRMALGAGNAAVLWMVMRQGLAAVVVGLGAGAVAGIALSRLMRGLLFDVEPTDPLTFVGVAAVLLATAVAASYVPARKAVQVSPMEALRGE